MPKTAILPQVRIDPELRARLEGMLRPGESLSDFVETSVRDALDYRSYTLEFDERARLALDAYERTGESIPTATVLDELRLRTEQRRHALKASRRTE